MNAFTELVKVLKAYKPQVIADETGLSKQTVYNILSGKAPSTATVAALYGFVQSQQIRIVRCLEPQVHEID